MNDYSQIYEIISDKRNSEFIFKLEQDCGKDVTPEEFFKKMKEKEVLNELSFNDVKEKWEYISEIYNIRLEVLTLGVKHFVLNNLIIAGCDKALESSSVPPEEIMRLIKIKGLKWVLGHPTIYIATADKWLPMISWIFGIAKKGVGLSA